MGKKWLILSFLDRNYWSSLRVCSPYSLKSLVSCTCSLTFPSTKKSLEKKTTFFKPFLAELLQQLCSLNWKFFWAEISFETTGGQHSLARLWGGRQRGDDGGTTEEGQHVVSPVVSLHWGDDRGGQHVVSPVVSLYWGDNRGGRQGGQWRRDIMWCPPVVSPVVSLYCGDDGGDNKLDDGGGTTCGVPCGISVLRDNGGGWQGGRWRGGQQRGTTCGVPCGIPCGISVLGGQWRGDDGRGWQGGQQWGGQHIVYFNWPFHCF